MVATSRRVQRCRRFPFLWTKEWHFNSLSVKMTIMTKTKTSKKESERRKKVTDDFRKKCYAMHEEQMRQSIVKIGRKLPGPRKANSFEEMEGECLPEMKPLGKKIHEEFLATQDGLDEVA